jgi:ATP-dependent RNA helicase RhlE
MTNFENFGLNETLIRAIEKRKYKSATPIQEQAIPHLLKGKDLLGIAQTGTGKTAAFALPILHNLLAKRIEPPKRGCRVLVLAPTRELVSQICDSFKTYADGTSLKIFALYGGVAHKPQIDKLIRGIDVLVATPGRLMDHIDDNNFRPKETEVLVLDEVDQMLDMGFIGSVRRLAAKINSNRQNLFFSATMPKEIQALADELLHNPVRVEVAPVSSAQEKVIQQILTIETSKKRSLLVDLFEGEHLSKVMVFTRTKHGADKVARHLSVFGISNVIIHGGKAQNQRAKSFEDFKAGRVRAMVATDVAARGIDIKEVSHVINFDMPTTPESYVHRIGRTARAGKDGHAYSICTPAEMQLLRSIERTTKQQIEVIDRRNDDTLIADKKVELPEVAPDPREERGQRRGKFGDKKRFENRGERAGRGDRSERRPARRNFEEHTEDKAAMNFVEASLNGEGKEDIVETGTFARRPRADGRKSRDNAANPPREFNREGRGEGRRSEGRSEGRRFEGRSGGRSEGGRSDRPARSFDDRPKRDFGDRPKRDFGDRPARSFDDRPKRDFGDRPKRDFGDRPARSFDDRPKRDFGDRPKRDFGDRPARSFDDRPKRDFGDRPKRDFGDRPARSFDDRPKRDFGDRPKRDFGDRPARSFDDKPKRDFGDKPRSFGGKPSFGDKPRGAKPAFGDKPRGGKPSFGGKSNGRPSGGNDRPKRKTFA